MKLSLVALALLLLPRAVLAQDRVASAPVRALASAHVVRGTEFYRQNAYAAALLEFQRAYAIDPDYRLLYDIGRAKRALEDFVGAAQSFERYIVEGRREHPSARGEAADAAGSDGMPAVSVTVTFHRLEVDAQTVEKLAALGSDDATALKVVLDQLRAREPARPVATDTVAHEAERAPEPTVVAAAEPAPAADGPRTRVARGIDHSDPYSHQ